MDRERILERAQKKKAGYAWLARIPFLVMAIIGIAIILAMKAHGIEQAYVTVVAVGCLLFYAGFVWSLPKFRIREDQLGDNCYYLGFLYTLVSLSWALWVFSIHPDDKLQIPEIVGNFGLALATTIAGILLRVVINQQRRDVVETEQEARRLLSEAVTDMRIQLNDASITMQAFQKEAKQAIDDALREQVKTANQALEESVAKVGDASKGVLERIDKAFEEFLDHSRKLNEISSGTVTAIQKLLERVEHIEAPADLLTRRLEPALAAAARAGELLRQRIAVDEDALKQASARSGQIQQALDGAASSLQAISSSFKGSVEEVRRAGEAASRIVEDLGRISSVSAASVERQERLSQALATGFESAVAALKAHNDGLASELERSRRMTGETGEALAGLAESITRRVGEMRVLSFERPNGAAK